MSAFCAFNSTDLLNHASPRANSPHITDVVATHNGKTVLQAEWSGAVSQNPFLAFKFKGAAKGDKVVVKWVDNKGDTRTDEAAIA